MTEKDESIQFNLPKELNGKVRNIFYREDESILNIYLPENDGKPVTSKVDKFSMRNTLELFNGNIDGTLDKEAKLQCIYSIKFNLRRHNIQFDDKEQQWYSETFPLDPGLEPKQQKQKQKKSERKPKEDRIKEIVVNKYSGNGKYKLNEAIILDGIPSFVSYDNEKDKISVKPYIEEHARIIIPPSENSPFIPYEFANEGELNDYFRRAKDIKSFAELYNASKHFWKLYVDHDDKILTILATDTILTYFQDLFPIIHYVECVGTNDVGKSSIGYLMQCLGYRAIKATSISGPNYFRTFGDVEPGQCVIIEDEGDNISNDAEKVKILKSGYEHDEKVPKTNPNTQKQEQSWFYVYCYKMILAEHSLKQYKAKGLVDRTFSIACRPGKVNYSIKNVISRVINKSPKLTTLYNELLDFRKILMCYRLIHYKDQLANIKTNLINRDSELSHPTLQLFYGTSVFEDVKKSMEFFIKQRHSRKARSLEAALYPILKSEVCPVIDDNQTRLDINIKIPFSDIWEKVIKGNEIDGSYDDKKKNEYDTTEYGRLYNNTLSQLIVDTFGADIKHTNRGSELTFNLEKFRTFRDRYEEGKEDEVVEIKVELESDGSDGSEGSGYGSMFSENIDRL